MCWQELIVPQNDVDIYDGEAIDGSMEAKSKNNWVQIFDMIDLTFNNLQQQNKELKRTVNELSSKVNKVGIRPTDREDQFCLAILTATANLMEGLISFSHFIFAKVWTRLDNSPKSRFKRKIGLR